MITAIVRYQLPETIDHDACLTHFAMIAPGFREVPGLVSKHFIWSDSGVAGGVYQWKTREEAEAFYAGPWRTGIIERYGMEPTIEYFTTFAVTNNEAGEVRVFEPPLEPQAIE
jgi:hypothetical protein